MPPTEPAQVDTARPAPLGTPCLDLWRREVRAGVRGQRVATPSTWHPDMLWLAACWEQSALEAERLGLHDSGRRDRERAMAIIVQPAAERRAA